MDVATRQEQKSERRISRRVSDYATRAALAQVPHLIRRTKGTQSGRSFNDENDDIAFAALRTSCDQH
ncbi:hypothetical protein C5688_20855 [Methylocystis sp. MitZ-2018]|nr:hypothetical protein C5688_20855 [Methylocystis sp. MitZ-2018]